MSSPDGVRQPSTRFRPRPLPRLSSRDSRPVSACFDTSSTVIVHVYFFSHSQHPRCHPVLLLGFVVSVSQLSRAAVSECVLLLARLLKLDAQPGPCSSFTRSSQTYNRSLFSIFFWLGYSNSTLNPVLYAIFNVDFRRAFQFILDYPTCQSSSTSVNPLLRSGFSNFKMTAVSHVGFLKVRNLTTGSYIPVHPRLRSPGRRGHHRLYSSSTNFHTCGHLLNQSRIKPNYNVRH